MNLEDTILSEIRQSQKYTNTVWLDLYEVLRVMKFIEAESRIEVSRDWGNREFLFMATKFQFYKMKRVLYMNVVKVAQQYECI